jgi:hypothetical protein
MGIAVSVERRLAEVGFAGLRRVLGTVPRRYFGPGWFGGTYLLPSLRMELAGLLLGMDDGKDGDEW